MNTHKLKVLLIAEAANPEWVSVPLIGWSLSRALSDLAIVHMVTQIRNREAILRANLIEGEDFTSINSEFIAKKLWHLSSILRGGKGKGWTTVQALSVFSYYYFEYLVWRKFGTRITNREFDIVHRLTPISLTTPSLLAKQCKCVGIPFVLGPLNGGLPWPKGFNVVRHKEKEWLSYVRLCTFFYKLLPGYHATQRNAAAILMGSKAIWNEIPSQYHAKCVYIPENAVNPDRFFSKSTRQSFCPLKIVFIGRLTPYKGADMLIEAALPLAKRNLISIDIIGDGPQMEKLNKRVKREKIMGKINFSGWIKHAHLRGKLTNADIFAFPSIREFGGAVVLEAMAAGAVPIVMNYGGPAELVTPKTGFLIKMGTRTEIVKRLRKILTELVENPGKINIKKKDTLKRVQEYFTWEKKANQVHEVYKWVLGERKSKPDFGMPFPDVE